MGSGSPVVRMVAGDDGRGDRSVLALPIEIGGEVAAVLMVTRPAGAATFGPVDLGIADLLVSQVAVAMHNAELHATVSEAAVRDPLTGLLNRRYFDEAVETAFATARRDGSPLSLIVLDLDRFSAVNNDHGHVTGDVLLRRVAAAIDTTVRAGDVVARYGGEEFVVIAPNSTADQAVAVAERIRSAVAGGADRHHHHRPRVGRGGPEPVDHGLGRGGGTDRRRDRRTRPVPGGRFRHCWPRSAPVGTGWSRSDQSTTVCDCSRMNWAT